MDQDLAKLLSWAAEHGVRDSVSQAQSSLHAAHPPLQSESSRERSCLGASLAVAMFPEAGGRGLAATRDLAVGEVVLAVPEALLMSAHSARRDPALGPLLAAQPTLTSHQVLVVHLLHEVAKGAASFWRDYLLALPRTHHTLAHFSPPQVLQLQFPPAMEAARRARTEAHRDWAAAGGLLRALCLPPKFCRFKAWLWAAATVTSRTVAVPFDGAGALCPVGDLFNYAAPSAEDETARLTDGAFDEETRCFYFYARQEYRKGQQVLLCYGAYRNLELLEHYGFLLPDNPNDALTVPLPATLHPRASIELSGCDAHSEALEARSECHIKADGQPSFALMAGLRLRAASAVERKRYGHLASAGMQLSLEGDAKSYEWLKTFCQALLCELPSSLESDLSMNAPTSNLGKVITSKSKQPQSIPGRLYDEKIRLATSFEVDSLTPLAICWRAMQKRILVRGIAYATQQLRELQSDGLRPD